MLTTYEKHSRTKLVTTMVAVLVIAGVVVLADHLKSQSATHEAQTTTSSTTMTPASSQSATTGTTPQSGSSTSSTSSSSSYKDGTYTASSDYFVPHGNENIRVSLTLQNGVVTSSSIQNSETDPTSAEFQQQFAAMYKSYVVGKKISNVQLGVVAGASDTTQAFNDAVNQIATKAQG